MIVRVAHRHLYSELSSIIKTIQFREAAKFRLVQKEGGGMQKQGKLGKSSSVVKINKSNVDSESPDVPLRNVLLKPSQKVGNYPCGNQQQEQQLQWADQNVLPTRLAPSGSCPSSAQSSSGSFSSHWDKKPPNPDLTSSSLFSFYSNYTSFLAVAWPQQTHGPRTFALAVSSAQVSLL